MKISAANYSFIVNKEGIIMESILLLKDTTHLIKNSVKYVFKLSLIQITQEIVKHTNKYKDITTYTKKSISLTSA